MLVRKGSASSTTSRAAWDNEQWTNCLQETGCERKPFVWLLTHSSSLPLLCTDLTQEKAREWECQRPCPAANLQIVPRRRWSPPPFLSLHLCLRLALQDKRDFRRWSMSTGQKNRVEVGETPSPTSADRHSPSVPYAMRCFDLGKLRRVKLVSFYMLFCNIY